MRFSNLVILFLCALGCCARVYASNSLGFDVFGGVGTSGFDVNGTLDLKPGDARSPYEALLSYAHQHSTTGTESRTDQYTGGVAHSIDDHWDGEVNLTGWKDSLNNIHYFGPTSGITYTWTQGSSDASSEAPTHPSDKNETSTEPPPKDEWAAVSLNAELFFYGTEVEASSTTRRVFDRKLSRFVQRVVPPTSTTEKVTQFHPSITAEKPLFDSAATPYVTMGHYFYSKDPGSIEALAGRPRFASSANRINGLVGGFLNNNGEVGLRLALPSDVDSDFRLGADQAVTDNTWATTQGATLSRTFFDHVKAKLDWSRVLQGGISSDLFSGGLTYTF